MESGNYTISSTPVKYPYKAYPSQIGMIDRVIKALQRNQNCLIESPTGSGKSLALLCAVLSWRQNEFDRVEKDIKQLHKVDSVITNSVFSNSQSSLFREENSTNSVPVVDLTDEDSFSEYSDSNRFVDLSSSPPRKIAKSPEKEEEQLSEEQVNDLVWEAKKKIPKIYFGTRTHKQLSQLIRELKKTAYANVKMTVLASRDQSCINEEVRREPNRSEACRALINPTMNEPSMILRGSCAYHIKWKKQFQKPYLLRGAIRREQFASGLENSCGAWDIEDLVEIGQKHGFCPYFAASTTLLADAELVFCPYNYLLDPLVRDSVGLDLKDQIVIFDEAHNIEDVCRDSSSFILTLSELHEAADNYELAASLNEHPSVKYSKFLGKICRSMVNWLNEVTSGSMTMQSHQVQIREWRGSEFITVLAKLDLLEQAADSIKNALQQIDDFDENEEGPRPRTGNIFQKGDLNILIASKKAMEKLSYFLGYFYKADADDYRVCVKQEQIRGDPASKKFVFRQVSNTMVSLNLWCMNPASAFKDIGASAKSIILASGTLAPMNTFETELGIPFKLQLEATHVLPKDRMLVASIAKGPSGRNLRVTYQNTSEWAFQDELGQLVLDICTIVPKGVLCFLPSYKLLDSLLERWDSTGALQRLSAKKCIVIEPKTSEQLHDTMQQFYNAVQNPSNFGSSCTGAIFLAVCRGKVSEGLDFADDNARAVITIGIPYPNFSGLEVVHKRDYNNERIRRGQSTLSGDQWYEIQAYRALNQALGRCLRHRQDWGALILVDERFGSRDSRRYCGNLSRWIRENIKHYDSFGKALTDLDTFTKKLTNETNITGHGMLRNNSGNGLRLSPPGSRLTNVSPPKSQFGTTSTPTGVVVSKPWKRYHFSRNDSNLL